MGNQKTALELQEEHARVKFAAEIAQAEALTDGDTVRDLTDEEKAAWRKQVFG